MQVKRARRPIPSLGALGQHRLDARRLLGGRRIVDDHAKIGPAIDGKGGIFALLGWAAKEKGLIEDIDQPCYFNI
ncbi:hypothetical protein [Bradyrhizobium sp. Cp5.3]|uniref:hypothetical protein n=1 Tax=Bradyrhizobium sp. Cp5.3 TaxID=443598 RepID=UPI0012EB9E43